MPRIVPSLVRRLSVVSVLAVAAGAHPLHAQGSLSVQGFGYPTGETSTRADGTGGALGEFDALSALNPAAIAQHGRPTVSFQYVPEFRSVSAGGTSESATIARFPLIAIGLPARGGLRFGVSATTFLDRSYTTRYRTTAVFDGDTVQVNNLVESRGSIADIRFGVARSVGRTLRLGVAGHFLTGDNRIVNGRGFSDSTRFALVSDSTTVSYRGGALSAGAEFTPIRGVGLAASYRYGLKLRAQRQDTTITEADTPDRMGVALRYDRISGATLVASWARTNWSSMAPLGSSALQVHDADELRAGIEAVGPRLGDFPIMLRIGGSRRTLPFGVGGSEVRETAFGGGLGVPVALARAVIDLGVQRAQRSPVSATGALSGASERAWQLGIGLTIRP